MFNIGEFQEMCNSKDVQLLTCSIQKRGKDLLYLQGCISMGISMGYELVQKMSRNRKTCRFEGMGCLIVGILSLASKIRGSYKRVCKALLEMRIEQKCNEDYGSVRKICVGKHEAILFTLPEADKHKEITAASLLQTEVVLCTLFMFRLDFPDCHDILWKRLYKSKASSLAKKTAWIILTDILSQPLLSYFSSQTVITAAEYMASKIHKEKESFRIYEEQKDFNQIQIIEKEMLKMYKKNYEASEEFIEHKENMQGLSGEDVNEK